MEGHSARELARRVSRAIVAIVITQIAGALGISCLHGTAARLRRFEVEGARAMAVLRRRISARLREALTILRLCRAPGSIGQHGAASAQTDFCVAIAGLIEKNVQRG